jgi:hypothetical protein
MFDEDCRDVPSSDDRRLEAAYDRAQAINLKYQEIEAGEREPHPGEIEAFPVFVQACARAADAQLNSTTATLLERAIADYALALERAGASAAVTP